MNSKKIGKLLLYGGLAIIAFALLADLAGFGKPGIQAMQILLAEFGVILALLGYVLDITLQDDPQPWKGLGRFVSSPVTAVLVGLVLGFFVFQILPMFLNSTLRMEYFYRYLPDKYPIGLDMDTLLNRIRTWFELKTPYPGDIPQFYPPLTYALFAPMALLDYRTAFWVMTILTLLAYLVLTLCLPLWMHPGKNQGLVYLLFASGLVSYGFQFELERGQYNVVTMLFCILAVYLYHYQHKLRLVGYFLFSIAVQLKVFPAIFILMFIKDWRDWRANLKRFAGLALLNILFLFILGYRTFLDFLAAISVQLANPTWKWNGNHSIQAFVFNLLKDGYGLIAPTDLATLVPYESLMVWSLLAIFFMCLGSILFSVYRADEKGLNPYLLSVCTLGALIIPTSNDYTLSFFIAIFAMFVGRLPAENSFKAKPIASLLLALTSFAYMSSLIPFKYKPYFLNNSFPALFVMLLTITCLHLLRDRSAEAQVASD